MTPGTYHDVPKYRTRMSSDVSIKRSLYYGSECNQQGVCDIPNTFCGVGEHIPNIIAKPTNSPTQGQPNPTSKNRLKSGILGHFFPQQIIFSWVGIDFIWETDYKKPNPTKISANILTTSRGTKKTPPYGVCG